MSYLLIHYQINSPGMGGALAAMVLPVTAVQLSQGTSKETSPTLGRKLKIQIGCYCDFIDFTGILTVCWDFIGFHGI